MAVQLSQTPVVEHEIPIGEIHKNDHERYIISAFENTFGTFINVREWFQRGDMPWRPGRQGMCIPAALAAEVAEMIHRAAPDPAELELDDEPTDHVAAAVARAVDRAAEVRRRIEHGEPIVQDAADVARLEHRPEDVYDGEIPDDQHLSPPRPAPRPRRSRAA